VGGTREDDPSKALGSGREESGRFSWNKVKNPGESKGSGLTTLRKRRR